MLAHKGVWEGWGDIGDPNVNMMNVHTCCMWRRIVCCTREKGATTEKVEGVFGGVMGRYWGREKRVGWLKTK